METAPSGCCLCGVIRTSIAVGTLGGDPACRPESHPFVGSKASWFDIVDDLSQHERRLPGVAS
ncbi:MAG: hypothetical protein CL908_09845 [Deltaproteobacteria bacterium]|nr:hypothetical protein [Deltaproteobacteria bacterium]